MMFNFIHHFAGVIRQNHTDQPPELNISVCEHDASSFRENFFDDTVANDEHSAILQVSTPGSNHSSASDASASNHLSSSLLASQNVMNNAGQQYVDSSHGSSVSDLSFDPQALQSDSEGDDTDESIQVSQGTQTIRRSIRIRNQPNRLNYGRRSYERFLSQQFKKRAAWLMMKTRRYSSIRH